MKTRNDLNSIKNEIKVLLDKMKKWDLLKEQAALIYIKNCLDSFEKHSGKSSKTTMDLKFLRAIIKSKSPWRAKPVLCSVRKGIEFRFRNREEFVKRATIKCLECNVQCATKFMYLKHLETHSGFPKSCLKCKKTFQNDESFEYHIAKSICKLRKNNKSKFKCEQCSKTFKFAHYYKWHLEGHIRNNCTYCNAVITKRKQLIKHMHTVHNIQLERSPFKCEFCDKKYVKRKGLYNHLKCHANGKIVCMECGYMSETREENEKHFLSHEKDRPWKCEECGQKFSRKQQYLFHINRHDKYKCLTCKESFASKSQALRHKHRGHSVTGCEPQMLCSYCPMAFHRKMTLMVHMRKHTNKKPLYCRYCDKSFRTPYGYFRHCISTVHDIKSPEKVKLSCKHCGKKFEKRHKLRLHLNRMHRNETYTHSCKFCDYKTRFRANLDRHSRLHLNDKKEFVCEQCGKDFYSLETLKDHISYMHVQEKQFKCDQCDKAFKRNSELVRHKSCHSTERPHVCQICGESYKRANHLRRHEENKHGTVKSNRRVQRMTKGKDGTLVPIPIEKKAKPTKKHTKPDLAVPTPVAGTETLILLDLNQHTTAAQADLLGQSTGVILSNVDDFTNQLPANIIECLHSDTALPNLVIDSDFC